MEKDPADRPVVIGVDGSELALQAVAWGAREAVRRGLPLRLVTVIGQPETGHLGESGPGPGYLRSVLTETARGQLITAAAVARDTSPGLAVDGEVRRGNPVPVLVEESSRAALMVVGARGRGGIGGVLAGSVAIALTAHAACPTVVVRGAPTALGVISGAPVVVGVDRSPRSEPAVRFAFEEAALRGVALVAAHTWVERPFGHTPAVLVDWSAIEEGEHQVLAEQVGPWAEKFPEVEVRPLLNHDRAANTLGELSAGAQLVVVGSRGRGGLTGALLGSVGRVLVHRAHCPVAVVR